MLNAPGFLMGQEKQSKVQVKITVDGETLKDTVYEIQDRKTADLAVKMMDATLGNPQIKLISDSTKGSEGEIHVFYSQDGEKEIIKSFEDSTLNETVRVVISSGDKTHSAENFKWIEEENTTVIIMDREGQQKVIKKKKNRQRNKAEEENENQSILKNSDENEKEVEVIIVKKKKDDK